eukprot:11921529-Alexandrium_andersonii.AAC.1
MSDEVPRVQATRVPEPLASSRAPSKGLQSPPLPSKGCRGAWAIEVHGGSWREGSVVPRSAE